MKVRILFYLLLASLSNVVIAQYSNFPKLECNEVIVVAKNEVLDSLSIGQLECLLHQKLIDNPTYETLNPLLKQLNSRRKVFQKQSNYLDSKKVTVLTLHAWQSIDSLEQYSNRLTTLAYYHFRLGEIFDCYNFSLLALEIAKEHGFIEVEEKALSRLSWSNWRIKRYDEAIKLNNDRRPIVFDSINTDYKKYAWFNSAGTFNNNIEDYPKAQFYGDSAIYYATKLNSSRAVALTKSNMSSYFAGIDSMDYRLKLVEDALSINKRNKNKEQLGSNLGLKARLQTLLHQYKEAEQNYILSLQLATEIGDQPRQRIAYDGLATIYDSIGLYQKALYYEKKANSLDEELYGGANLNRFFDLEQTLFQKENKRLKAEQKIEELRIKQEQRNLQFLSALLLLGTIGIWLYLRNKIISQRRNRERLEELHKISIKNLEMDSLRSQMNPHFIFNCLNSIKGFISTNEPRVATRFLNKFSKLIRMILSHSKKTQVSLQEEIDALKLYIELEKLRLSDELNYSIIVDEGIDMEATYIPPLVIQPFVENSIWHGLALSKREKQLKIVIEKRNDYITILIADNGIGRQASKNNQILNDSNHKSYGINITQERIAHANLKNKALLKDEVSFKDLILSNGEPGGTEVTLSIKS